MGGEEVKQSCQENGVCRGRGRFSMHPVYVAGYDGKDDSEEVAVERKRRNTTLSRWSANPVLRKECPVCTLSSRQGVMGILQ